MAERRMFAKTIIDSDAFTEMPLSAQALYFHLGMRADDDGFINNAKRVQRSINASDDDMRILLAKRFVLSFTSGVYVVKHWKIHNYIQKDRYKPTVYVKERALLRLTENNAYTEIETEYTQCIQDVYKVDTQGRTNQSELRIEGDSACARKELPTPTELRQLFNIEIDVPPAYPIADYLKIKVELDKSQFAQHTIKTLSMLHKHAKEIMAGHWRDFQRKNVSCNIIQQNYDAEQIANVFKSVDEIDPDTEDI